MATKTQSQAKQVSVNWLSEQARINNLSAPPAPAAPKVPTMDYNANANTSSGFLDQWYGRMTNDARNVAERSSVEARRDRESRERIAAMQSGAMNSQQRGGNTLSTPVVSTTRGGAFGEWSGSMTLGTNFIDNGAANDYYRKQYENQRNQAVTTARMITRAEASGDIARIEAQTKAASRAATDQARLAAQERSWQAAQAQSERNWKSTQSEADRVNQRYMANLDAQTRMFANITGGNGGGFQYWGGSI